MVLFLVNIVLLIRVIDDLPAASVVTVGDSEDDFWYEDTYPIGYTTEDGKHAVYNHVFISYVYFIPS